MHYILYTLDNKFIKKVKTVPDSFTGICRSSLHTKRWLLNRLLHREDGPAVEYLDGTKEWWINNKQYTEQQHKLFYDMKKLKGLL